MVQILSSLLFWVIVLFVFAIIGLVRYVRNKRADNQIGLFRVETPNPDIASFEKIKEFVDGEYMPELLEAYLKKLAKYNNLDTRIKPYIMARISELERMGL